MARKQLENQPIVAAKQRQSPPTIANTHPASSRQPIALREAMRLADEILFRAEEGRIRAAEEEASRPFDLENLK